MRIPLISRFIQPRASTQNTLWGSAYTFFFGGTSSGKAVNERTAMQTTAVYKYIDFCRYGGSENWPVGYVPDKRFI